MEPTLLAPRLRPRLHDRGRGRADQPARASGGRWPRAGSVGLVSGLGVATADATYGAIAAFGLTAITDLLVDWRRRSASSAGCSCCGWPGGRSVPCPGAAADRDGRDAAGCRRLPLERSG